MLRGRGPISKLVGEAVNFTKEYRADQKERKEAQEAKDSQQHIRPVQESNSTAEDYDDDDDDDNDDDDDDDEASSDDSSEDSDWARDLDEAQLQAQQEDPTRQPAGNQDVDPDDLLQRFISEHPPPPAYSDRDATQLPRLPMPVILPQRRPEARHRGFVRAYAPVLAECGIDQTTWLEFLDGFEKNIKANPWFGVMNAGVMVADLAHTAVGGFSPTVMLVSMAIKLGIDTSRQTYMNYKQNGYVDTMNEQFFKPRALFCLVVKYKPSSDVLVENIDLENNIAKAIDDRDGQSKWKNAIRSSTTTTTAQMEAEIPEPAPLVFPGLDALDDGKKKNAARQFGQFVSKYFDKRATAKFDARHPNSKLTQAANQGDKPLRNPTPQGLLSMVSGGNVVGRRQRKRNQRAAGTGYGSRRQMRREGRKQRRGNRPLKQLMKHDALYLMVVNLPSKEEMDAVLGQMERAGA